MFLSPAHNWAGMTAANVSPGTGTAIQTNVLWCVTKVTGDCECLPGVGGSADNKCCQCSHGFFNFTIVGCQGNILDDNTT